MLEEGRTISLTIAARGQCRFSLSLSHLPDDVLAPLVVPGLRGLLGLLGAHLVVLGGALLVGDVPGDRVALQRVQGLAWEGKKERYTIMTQPRAILKKKIEVLLKMN